MQDRVIPVFSAIADSVPPFKIISSYNVSEYCNKIF